MLVILTFIQQLLNGLVLGSEYALFAGGFALIFGTLGSLNFAYGASYSIAAYFAWIVVTTYKLPMIPVGIIVAIIMGGLTSLLTERIAFMPFRKRGGNGLSEAIATIAVSTIIINVIQMVFSGDPRSFPETKGLTGLIKFGGLSVSKIQLTILFISVIIMACLALFLKYAKVGKAVRAIAFRPETASLLGISTVRVTIYTFFISGVMAGAAGALMSIFFGSVTPYIASTMLLKALAIIVIGGMGNIWGAIIAGVLLGVVESLTVAYLSSSFREVFAFALFFIILLIRPSGLFGKGEVRRA